MNKDILNMKTVAYYSGYNGIEVKNILYGYDDYVQVVSGAWYGTRKAHTVKIYYETERPYFKINGVRIHLDECIRC